MKIEVLYAILWVIFALACLLGWVIFRQRSYERKLIPTCYDWLQFLSHTEWRNLPEIAYEMQKTLQVRASGASIIYTDLKRLIKEGLVKRSPYITEQSIEPGMPNVPQKTKYLLTPKGVKKRYDRDVHPKEDFDVTDGFGY